MEEYTLATDMKLFLVKAETFPDGIMAAFDKLEKMIGGAKGRTFFGISHGSKDGIIYKAGVLEAYDGEGKKLGCELFTVTKGRYLSETIMNWRDNIPKIGATFTEMCKHPQMDFSMPCVEWYKSETELMCMVKLQ